MYSKVRLLKASLAPSDIDDILGFIGRYVASLTRGRVMTARSPSGAHPKHGLQRNEKMRLDPT